MSVNKFIFTGHLTRDAEVRHSAKDPMSLFTLAASHTWRDAQGVKQERVAFFRIKRWGAAAADDARYLGKGSLVYVEGRIENTEYQKDGQTVYGNDFIAETVEYLHTKPPAGERSEAAENTGG